MVQTAVVRKAVADRTRTACTVTTPVQVTVTQSAVTNTSLVMSCAVLYASKEKWDNTVLKIVLETVSTKLVLKMASVP